MQSNFKVQSLILSLYSISDSTSFFSSTSACQCLASRFICKPL